MWACEREHEGESYLRIIFIEGFPFLEIWFKRVMFCLPFRV